MDELPEPLHGSLVGSEAIPSTESAKCWRCGKEASKALAACPYCDASLVSAAEKPGSGAHRMLDAGPEAQALIRTLLIFFTLLVISLITGIALRPTELFVSEDHQRSVEQIVGPIVFLEAVDTILVVFALFWVALPPERDRVGGLRRVTAWLGFWPVLVGLLALNFAYHRMLQQWLGATMAEETYASHPNLLPLWIVLICLQPAIVEELFFRHVALRTLRSNLEMHSAVWISAVMFALAHISAPMSMPILFMLGVSLGYARVASGGLLLPMAMHFVHNAVVIGVDW